MCRLVVRSLLMIALADVIIGDSALLLCFSESRTRSGNSTIVHIFQDLSLFLSVFFENCGSDSQDETRWQLFLRYYATVKMRKFESLFYKINTCLQITTTCNELRAQQIFSVNISYTHFSILGVTFTFPFLLFRKAAASCCKKILN